MTSCSCVSRPCGVGAAPATIFENNAGNTSTEIILPLTRSGNGGVSPFHHCPGFSSWSVASVVAPECAQLQCSAMPRLQQHLRLITSVRPHAWGLGVQNASDVFNFLVDYDNAQSMVILAGSQPAACCTLYPPMPDFPDDWSSMLESNSPTFGFTFLMQLYYSKSMEKASPACSSCCCVHPHLIRSTSAFDVTTELHAGEQQSHLRLHLPHAALLQQVHGEGKSCMQLMSCLTCSGASQCASYVEDGGSRCSSMLIAGPAGLRLRACGKQVLAFPCYSCEPSRGLHTLVNRIAHRSECP